MQWRLARHTHSVFIGTGDRHTAFRASPIATPVASQQACGGDMKEGGQCHECALFDQVLAVGRVDQRRKRKIAFARVVTETGGVYLLGLVTQRETEVRMPQQRAPVQLARAVSTDGVRS